MNSEICYNQTMKQREIELLQQSVLDWYRLFGRHDLPWRNLTVDKGYGVLVSEFMLQQTQVDRVIPKFKAFVSYFPTIQKLARAEQAKVVVLWSGLGYNRRAVQLHAAAKTIVKDFSGQVPSDSNILDKLPGVGAYTAGAIAVFAYNQPVLAWDTNVQRFFELLVWGYDSPSLAEAKRMALSFVPFKDSADWHAGVMDLMTQIRHEKSPRKQQAKLLIALGITPKWDLPELTDAPFKRAKQSQFNGSKRYYRALVVEYLRQKKDHKSTFSEITHHLQTHLIPHAYSPADIVAGLKKDKLIRFDGKLTPRLEIKL